MIVTVFGGAFDDKNTKEYKDSLLIGNILAEKNYTVKCGGYYGIMEAVSKGVYEKNGNVIGITCKSFNSIKANEYLSENILADNIYERLKLLITDTDIFIIQKGGIGTLSELFLTLDIIRKLKNKPKVILIGDFWKNIIDNVSILFNKNEINLFEIVSDTNELNNLL